MRPRSAPVRRSLADTFVHSWKGGLELADGLAASTVTMGGGDGYRWRVRNVAETRVSA